MAFNAFNMQVLDKESLLQARYLGHRVKTEVAVELALVSEHVDHVGVSATFKIGLRNGDQFANGGVFTVRRVIGDLSQVPETFWANVTTLRIKGSKLNSHFLHIFLSEGGYVFKYFQVFNLISIDENSDRQKFQNIFTYWNKVFRRKYFRYYLKNM